VEDMGQNFRVLNSIEVLQKHPGNEKLFLVLPSADRKHEVGFIVFRKSERRKNMAIW
jgi:hypothetical protein